MRPLLSSACLFLVAFQALIATSASAHPASGIVVNANGDVFFVHTGHGVCKIDAQGKLTKLFQSKGGHWLCLDEEGRFSRTQPKHFKRITPSGLAPALIFADGGSPIAVLRDGNLYYASNDEKMTPGGLQVTRMSPDGVTSVFPPDGKMTTGEFGITGLAAGPQDALYITSPSAVLKLKMDGTFTTLAHPIVLTDCDVDYPDNDPNSPLPYLRGLAVDEQGTVFAAGTSCHCVVKVTPQGKVETILKAERPWSPTGVAVHGRDIYVLEYTNANGSPNEGWVPRVRKLGPDGKVTILTTVADDEHKREP
jgi:hypothetical protein